MSAYAGAGLNQTVSYGDGLVVPDPLYRRNRSRSIGAAAELGAEYRASERLLVGASLRWAELDAQAVQLASDAGMVGADELSAGVSLGWRFR
jgi:outer membrane protein W